MKIHKKELHVLAKLVKKRNSPFLHCNPYPKNYIFGLNPASLTIFLFIILLIVSLISMMQGTYQLNWMALRRILIEGSSAGIPYEILIHIRLPRLILAILTGATFGTVGTALQAIFRNPLADPSLIGITSGASSGAAFALVSASMIEDLSSTLTKTLSVQFSAFLCSLLTVSLLYAYAINQRKETISTMLLAGIAINAISSAMISGLTYIADEESLRLLNLWSLGSFSQVSWKNVHWVTPPCSLAIAGLISASGKLNILQLGNQEASRLGLSIKRLTNWVFFLSTIALSALISHTGIVAFLGLIAPHCIRFICGANCRLIMPNAAIFGAILAVTADLLARTLFAPLEVPLSIITAMIGAPFFLYLLTHK